MLNKKEFIAYVENPKIQNNYVATSRIVRNLANNASDLWPSIE